MRFTFLHAADLHLGSPLLGLSLKDEAVARRFAEASRAAFSALVTRALEEQVAFVLIAGDVYDGEWRDTSIGLFFARELGRLARADIPVFLIRGNHDAESVVTGAITLPDNVTSFPAARAQTKRLESLRVAIHGRSFPHREVTENWVPSYPEPVPGWFNIGLLHTSCTGRPGHASYAPCSVEDLTARGYDDWALGHVHEFEVLARAPWIVFPGNLQGRSVRECGPKGAVFIDVEDGQVTGLRRLIVDHARWAALDIDVSTCDSEAAMLRALDAQFAPLAHEAEGRLVATRVRLSGESPLHRRLVADHARIADEVLAAAQRHGQDIWIEKLRIETREARQSAAPDLAGVDLAALLDGVEPAACVRVNDLVDSLRAKSSGAILALDGSEAAALVAEARALLLARASGGEG